MNKKKQLLSGYSELVEITLKTQPCFPILSNTLVIKASLIFQNGEFKTNSLCTFFNLLPGPTKQNIEPSDGPATVVSSQ